MLLVAVKCAVDGIETHGHVVERNLALVQNFVVGRTRQIRCLLFLDFAAAHLVGENGRLLAPNARGAHASSSLT